jgi:hypothetical protein
MRVFVNKISGNIFECIACVMLVLWVLVIVCVPVACFSGVRFEAEFGCSVWLSGIDSKKVPIVVKKFDWFVCVSAVPVQWAQKPLQCLAVF